MTDREQSLQSAQPTTVQAAFSFVGQLSIAVAGSFIFAFLAFFGPMGHNFSAIFWVWDALPITLAAQARRKGYARITLSALDWFYCCSWE